MAPRGEASVDRVAQIHQAALKLFARDGYHQTSMDDIVTASGLSKGTLYWHFKSKRELFLSLVERVMGQLVTSWDAALPGADATAMAKIHASLSFLRSEVGPIMPIFCVMLEAWALTRQDEDIQARVRASLEPFYTMMERLIQEGVAAGEFRVTSVHDTAFVLITLIKGLAMAMGSQMWHHDWNDVVDAIEELVLNGLCRKGPCGAC